MADNLLNNPNNNTQNCPSVDKNEWSRRVNTQLNETTNQNSLKSTKLLSQRIRKHYYINFGTRV